MEYLIGVGLSLLVYAFARLVGFDRDRVFYPTMLLVVATYYILFAVMGGSMPALGLESPSAVAFLVLAVVGFKKNLWVIVAALAGHGFSTSFITGSFRIQVSRCGGPASACRMTFLPEVSLLCY